MKTLLILFLLTLIACSEKPEVKKPVFSEDDKRLFWELYRSGYTDGYHSAGVFANDIQDGKLAHLKGDLSAISKAIRERYYTDFAKDSIAISKLINK